MEQRNNGRKRSNKSGMYQNSQRKRKFQAFVNIGSGQHKKKKNKDERKSKKRVPQKKKLLETKLCIWNFIKEIKTWTVLVSYSGPFFKLTREKLRKMDQEIDDDAQGLI